MRGQQSPFVIDSKSNKRDKMIDRKRIEKLIEDLLHGTTFFLVELKISEANNIQVFIDGDSQVSITDCVMLSKGIETDLDRDEDDFELHVSSAGLDLPLKKRRQYKKYLNKLLMVKTIEEDKRLLRLESVNEDGIIATPLKKNKNAKKGAPKQFIELEKVDIPFESIIETRIEVIF